MARSVGAGAFAMIIILIALRLSNTYTPFSCIYLNDAIGPLSPTTFFVNGSGDGHPIGGHCCIGAGIFGGYLSAVHNPSALASSTAASASPSPSARHLRALLLFAR